MVEPNPGDLLSTARRLSEALSANDLDGILSQITEAACQFLPQADFASISIQNPDGTLMTRAATDEIVLILDEAQYELHEGPCYDAVTDAPRVFSTDLAADARWPVYGPRAFESGVRSQMAFRLYHRSDGHGALNIYSETLGAFQDDELLSSLFTSQAAMALSYVSEIENLNHALSTRKQIGQAIGIVMERYQMPEDRAFAFLIRVSQDSNTKLKQVASEVVASVGRH